MTAGTNETGRRASETRSRIYSTVAVTALFVLACSPAASNAKDHGGGHGIGQATDQKQHKASKQQAGGNQRAASAPAGKHVRKRRAAAPTSLAPSTIQSSPARSAQSALGTRAGVSTSGGSPAATFKPVAATTPTSTPHTTTAATPTRHRTQAASDPRPVSRRGPASRVRHTVTRTVRDVVHVIPGWIQALLLALVALLGAAALLIAGAALRNRRLRRQRSALLEEVGVLQAALLPDVPPRVGALAVSVAYRPAQGLAAGGDFYDVFPLDRGRVGLVVGDVSGHGRESLGPATFIRHMVRSYLEAGLIPRAALQLAGKVVDGHSGDDFATVVAAIHDPSAGTLSYATAGHPPPIITGPANHASLTVASSPPIGVGSPTGLRQTTLPLAPGSSVCFFTDGLVEARRAGGIFGMPRLERIVRELDPDATAGEVIGRVAREADTVPDDVAVCLIRTEGGSAAAGTVRVEEIEVTLSELHGQRLRRFLEACDISAAEVEGVIKAAAPRVVKYGSVVLRVRLAEGRSGVDVVPVETAAPVAELATLHRSS